MAKRPGHLSSVCLRNPIKQTQSTVSSVILAASTRYLCAHSVQQKDSKHSKRHETPCCRPSNHDSLPDISPWSEAVVAICLRLWLPPCHASCSPARASSHSLRKQTFTRCILWVPPNTSSPSQVLLRALGLHAVAELRAMPLQPRC